MRVDVAAYMTKTLPDPNNPLVTGSRCRTGGGAVSVDGLWCLAGDYACYRIDDRPRPRPR